MTLTEIISLQKATYVSNRAIAGLPYDNPENWSIYNIKRLLLYVSASTAYLMFQLFGQLKIDTDTSIKLLKPHSVKWWANAAKKFQYGFNLLPDNDEFDNTGYTASQIAASKIITTAAVDKKENQYGRRYLRMKLAKTVANELAVLDNNELNAVTSYFERVGDAGVKLQIQSLPPDSLKCKIIVYYDPQILNNNGSRIDGTASDVIAVTMKTYLKQLPYNGVFVWQYMIDKIQAVNGVVNVDYNPAEVLVKYGNFPFAPVTPFYNPDGGYLRFVSANDLEIQYLPHEPVQ